MSKQKQLSIQHPWSMDLDVVLFHTPIFLNLCLRVPVRVASRQSLNFTCRAARDTTYSIWPQFPSKNKIPWSIHGLDLVLFHTPLFLNLCLRVPVRGDFQQSVNFTCRATRNTTYAVWPQFSSKKTFFELVSARACTSQFPTISAFYLQGYT